MSKPGSIRVSANTPSSSAAQEAAGKVAAKARGVAFGRPKKMRPDQQQVDRELVRDGKSISAVARTFDVKTGDDLPRH